MGRVHLLPTVAKRRACTRPGVALLCAMLTACGTQPLMPVAPGGPLAIVTTTGAHLDHVRLGTARRVAEQDVTAGAIGGIAAGAALSLACGPFAPLCLPSTMQLGMHAGAGVGALAAYGAVSPGEARRAMQQAVERYDRAHPPRDAAIAALREQAAKQWTLADDDRKTPRIVVKRVQAWVELLPGEEAQAYVTVIVCPEVPGRAAWTAPDRELEYTGPPASVRAWAEDRDDFVAGNFERAYADIALRVVAEMTR